MVAQGVVTVFNLGGAADVQAHGGIEFKGVAAGCGFRIAEHYANLLTQLIDKYAAGAGFGDVGCELTQGL